MFAGVGITQICVERDSTDQIVRLTRRDNAAPELTLYRRLPFNQSISANSNTDIWGPEANVEMERPEEEQMQLELQLQQLLKDKEQLIRDREQLLKDKEQLQQLVEQLEQQLSSTSSKMDLYRGRVEEQVGKIFFPG